MEDEKSMKTADTKVFTEGNALTMIKYFEKELDKTNLKISYFTFLEDSSCLELSQKLKTASLAEWTSFAVCAEVELDGEG